MRMNAKTFLMFLIGLVLLAACASPAAQATPTSLPYVTTTPTLFIGTQPTLPLTLTPGAVTPAPITPVPGVTAITPSTTSTICTDPQVTALIDSFKSAILESDGALLSSLI